MTWDGPLPVARLRTWKFRAEKKMTKLSPKTTHLLADLLEANVIRVIASTQPVVVRGRHGVLM